jgi:hypothetical protein
MTDAVADKARQLRYKKPALEILHWEAITDGLYDLSSQCDSLQWAMQDDDALLDALGGNEEEAFEFRMAFGDLAAGAESLLQQLHDCYIDSEDFDAVMVGLLGNKYNVVGFDSIEEDYCSLTEYDQELATSAAGQRLMRLTKPEIIATVGRCLGISIAYLDVRHKHDYLSSSFDILKERDHSLLDTIKDIDALYISAEETGWRCESAKRFDMLLSYLPERVWVE